MSLFDIIQSIAADSSLKAKQAIMEANKGNECLRAAFSLTENLLYNYYIRFEDTTIIAGAKNGRDITESDFKIFADLNNRVVTGNAARDAFVAALQPLDEGARTIMVRILNRDLRCNAGTSLANKVWKGLIEEMPCMLAGKFDKKAIERIVDRKDGYIIQTKMDGSRAIGEVKDDGTVLFRSRGGNVVEIHGVFDGALGQHKGFTFDGELLVIGEDGHEDRKTGNGLFTKAVRGTLEPKDAARMHIVLWDMVPTVDYNNGFCDVPYKERLKNLVGISAKFNPNKVSVVETKFVSNIDEVQKFYQEMRDRGEEGAILKFADMPWEDKRSKHMIKMKAVNTADLKVVGWEEGTGKFVGMMGNLIVESSCDQLRCNVGSGFSEEQRKDPTKFQNTIVEIEYNEIITARGRDTKSLFLPIFKSIRVDKKVANALSELV